MRTHGTLIKWNDERGFGFILPAQGNDELFVHISAFPRDGARPRLNELVSYELETTADGKLRAVRILRANRQPASRTHINRGDSRRSGRLVETLLGILATAAIGIYAVSQIQSLPMPMSSSSEPVDISGLIPDRQSSSGSNFECDGRTMCSQMTSCDEARYFLEHCANTKMDGDGDRNPCEQQWCGLR